MDNLSAFAFQYRKEPYELEFEKILAGIVACYKMMIKDNVSVPNDENRIRDILLLKYLKKRVIKDKVKLKHYRFDRESPEDTTKGRVDIRIISKNDFEIDEAFYVIECKRLNNKNFIGTSGLNWKYIDEGMMRFVGRKYSTYYGVNGMIGFVVEKMDISGNITNINTLLGKSFPKANTKRELTAKHFIDKFKYQYYSEHKDVKNIHLILYHLMFDFSNNMDKTP